MRKKPSASSNDKTDQAKEETPTATGTGTFTGTGTDTGGKEASKSPKSPKEQEEEIDMHATDPKKDEKLRKYLLKLIEGLYKPEYKRKLYPFKIKVIVRVLVMVREIFKKEPVMVECRMPIVVVGDLHGQFSDLTNVFAMFDEGDIPGCFNQRFVFLGDYIDRGKQSLECIMMVFVLKVLFPAEFILLRGNHEMRNVNMCYGFHDELKERYPESYKILFEYFNQTFAFMPLCCIAGDAILCMHGGICPEMTSRDVFKGIPKPLWASKDHPVAESLMWADPMYGEPRCRPNWVRGLAVHFGEPLIDEICVNLGVKMIVRGHQMMLNGFKFFHGHKLVTVFTASNYYPDKTNHGAVMTVDTKGRIGFKIIVPTKNGEKMFRGEHEAANQATEDGYKTHPDIVKEREAAAWKIKQEKRMREEEEETRKRLGKPKGWKSGDK